MPRLNLGKNVFEAAVERMTEVFKAGHRVVCTFSAGKDSGMCVEVCLLALKEAGTGNGAPGAKLDVAIRDEEIMYPGTYEYAERMAARTSELNFYWLIAGQPVINVYNRAAPYFWVFDKTIDPALWVRQPPKIAQWIKELSITGICNAERFPPAPGKLTINVMGLRTQESTRRAMATYSAGGAFAGNIWNPTPELLKRGVTNGFPIYDWKDDDVWLAIKKFKWDYNSAYDVLNKMGVPRHFNRIAPPTLSPAGAKTLGVASRAWPHWFERVCKRLPGVRLAASYGTRVIMPHRKYGETWRECFERECIRDAPANWIAHRAQKAKEVVLARHASHATTDFPEVKRCHECGLLASWRDFAKFAYGGDPFALKLDMLNDLDPEFFRPGSGRWNGKPTW